jgi:hypothetical protein
MAGTGQITKPYYSVARHIFMDIFSVMRYNLTKHNGEDVVSMDVLGVKISAKTEEYAIEITRCLSRPIAYYFAPEGTRSTMDANDPTMYKIHLLRTGQCRFEAALLHELSHLRQFEQGYPMMGLKLTSMYDNAQNSFAELGLLIMSIVLDYEINHWLISAGYSGGIKEAARQSFDSFVKNRKRMNVNKSSDKHHLSLAVMILAAPYMNMDAKQQEVIKDLYPSFIMEKVINIVNSIRSSGANNPIVCVKEMCNILNTFGLWNAYMVFIGPDVLKTQKDAQKYFDAHMEA